MLITALEEEVTPSWDEIATNGTRSVAAQEWRSPVARAKLKPLITFRNTEMGNSILGSSERKGRVNNR